MVIGETIWTPQFHEHMNVISEHFYLFSNYFSFSAISSRNGLCPLRSMWLMHHSPTKTIIGYVDRFNIVTAHLVLLSTVHRPLSQNIVKLENVPTLLYNLTNFYYFCILILIEHTPTSNSATEKIRLNNCCKYIGT